MARVLSHDVVRFHRASIAQTSSRFQVHEVRLYVLANDVRYMLSSVRLSSICLSSVTLTEHPTHPVEIFGNISTAFGTLSTR